MIKFVGGLTEQQMSLVIYHLERKVPNEEKLRIIKENFFGSIIVPPVSNLFYRNNPFRNLSNFNLISISYNFYSKYKPEQIAAVLLHEIGHIINNPASTITEDKEFYADDYSRYCSFETELLENLELSINDETDTSRKELMVKRISRINEGSELLLNLK